MLNILSFTTSLSNTVIEKFPPPYFFYVWEDNLDLNMDKKNFFIKPKIAAEFKPFKKAKIDIGHIC